MKKEFESKLQSGEEILFYEVVEVNKSSKQIGRSLLLFVILILFWWLFIAEIKNVMVLDFKFLLILVALCALTIAFIYGIIYNLFFKAKKKNNEYFVTNKRIALYNSKHGFIEKNIAEIEHIGIVREKNNYGDIIFNFYGDSLINQLKNSLCFESVQNPRKVVELIFSLNDKIHIYDDVPTVFGKKIK